MADELQPQQWPKVFSGAGEIHVDFLWLQMVGMDRYYVSGYKQAADRLIGDAKTIPELFFPVAFLYRQYIELHLKYLIHCLSCLQVIHITDAERHGHDLSLLWKTTRKGLEVKWPNEGKDELDAAERVIMEFQLTDPTGQELRYAKFTTGKKKVPKTSLEAFPRCLSLDSLGEVMQKLHLFFHAKGDPLVFEISEIQNSEYNNVMEKAEETT